VSNLAECKGAACSRRAAPDWWTVKRQDGTSHRTLSRAGWPDYVFAFHDSEEIGARMLARIAKRTGLTPEDL
jgi:hypothetical protein